MSTKYVLDATVFWGCNNFQHIFFVSLNRRDFKYGDIISLV